MEFGFFHYHIMKHCNHHMKDLSVLQCNCLVAAACFQCGTKQLLPEKTYAPYKFKVRRRLINGEIVLGSNQEKCSQPIHRDCAQNEVATFFYAGSMYPDAKIVQMAITTYL
jgi:hypothetical protein